MRFRTNVWAWLLAGLHGCGHQTPIPETPPAWSIEASPLLRLGVTDGPSAEEFAGVVGGEVLDGGRVVVANSATGELRFFDEQGQFLGAHGRKGNGPGEFGWLTSLARGAADSLYTWDAGNMRAEIFDPAGRFIRVEVPAMDGRPLPAPIRVSLIGRNIVHGLGSGASALRRVLDSLPVPEEVRVVRRFGDEVWTTVPDGSGNGTSRWEVVNAEGLISGRLDLPAGACLLDVHADRVLLLSTDGLGVEQVSLHRLRRGGSPVSGPRRERAPGVAADSARLKLALRDLVIAEESYYADSSRYTASAADVARFGMPPGIRVVMFRADTRSWFGVAFVEGEGLLCGMGVGIHTPPGWLEGVPRCGAE